MTPEAPKPAEVVLTGKLTTTYIDEAALKDLHERPLNPKMLDLIRTHQKALFDRMMMETFFGDLPGVTHGRMVHKPAEEPHFVLCAYKTPKGRAQLTQVFCPRDDRAGLVAILERRGMGETLHAGASWHHQRPKMPSEHLLEGQPHKAMHAAIWLGMILNHCDPALGREVMMDDGAIHELSHYVETHYANNARAGFGGSNASLAMIDERVRIIRLLLSVERRVPGFYPTEGLSAEAAEHYDREMRERIAKLRDPLRPVIAFDTGKAQESLDRLIEATVKAKESMKSLVVFDDLFYGNHDVKAREFSGLKTKALPNQRTFEMGRLDDAKAANAKRIEAFMAAHDKKAASTPPKAGVLDVPMQTTSTEALMAALSPTGRYKSEPVFKNLPPLKPLDMRFSSKLFSAGSI